MLSRIYSRNMESKKASADVRGRETFLLVLLLTWFLRHSKRIIPQMHLQIAFRLFCAPKHSSCDNGQWL